MLNKSINASDCTETGFISIKPCGKQPGCEHVGTSCYDICSFYTPIDGQQGINPTHSLETAHREIRIGNQIMVKNADFPDDSPWEWIDK
jgi:hypothetical protein